MTGQPMETLVPITSTQGRYLSMLGRDLEAYSAIATPSPRSRSLEYEAVRSPRRPPRSFDRGVPENLRMTPAKGMLCY